MYESIEAFFERILHYAITGVEIIGALIILFYTVRALFCLLQKQHENCKDFLTTGISTGLSFLLTSEVLNTIIAPDWGAIGMTCAILLMRAGMTLLVHWENQMEHHFSESKQ